MKPGYSLDFKFDCGITAHDNPLNKVADRLRQLRLSSALFRILPLWGTDESQ